MAAEVHVGDVGAVIRITVTDQDGEVYDVSSATEKTIYLRKPNGDVLTKTASFYTTGADGILTYTVVSGDWSAAGNWAVQAKVVVGGNTFYTSIGSIPVRSNVTP